MCDHESLTGRCPVNMAETLKKHLDYCQKQKDLYELDENFYLGRKRWAFTYCLKNIMRADYDKQTKENLYKDAFTKLLDTGTIEKMFSGVEQKRLLKGFLSNNPKIYVRYVKYNPKTVFYRILGKIGRVKRSFFKHVKEDS